MIKHMFKRVVTCVLVKVALVSKASLVGLFMLVLKVLLVCLLFFNPEVVDDHIVKSAPMHVMVEMCLMVGRGCGGNIQMASYVGST